MLCVFYTLDYDPYVVEIGLIFLLEYVLEAIISTMLRQLGPKSHNLLSEWIIIIGDASADAGIHHREEIAEIVLAIVERVLILLEIEPVINQLKKLEDLQVHRAFFEIEVILLLLRLSASHF